MVVTDEQALGIEKRFYTAQRLRPNFPTTPEDQTQSHITISFGMPLTEFGDQFDFSILIDRWARYVHDKYGILVTGSQELGGRWSDDHLSVTILCEVLPSDVIDDLEAMLEDMQRATGIQCSLRTR